MDTLDPHALDPNVDAFITAQRAKRYRGAAPAGDAVVHAAPLWAEASNLNAHGGSLRLEYGYCVRHTAFMPYTLARDLAAAINAVLMRHADADKAAHERVRDIVVTAADGEVF